MLSFHSIRCFPQPVTIMGSFMVTVAAFLLNGCASVMPGSSAPDSQLVIPDFPSAKEQYGFAVLFKDGMITATDKGRREMQVARLSQCYGRVISSYPEDPIYTPLARLEIADALRSIGETRKARREYEQLIAGYPENEYVQARSMFSIGRVLDQTGDFQEAKNYYKRVNEEFGESPSGAVLDIVRRADTLYYSIRETNAPKKKNQKKKR